MATSSPYSQNDYGVFNYRPYSLPVNQIAAAFTAKNNAWEVGAQRVKSRYDSIMDLDLSKDENKKIRDEFMQKAQGELQKLSTQDLSDPTVQRKGLTLFQPLLQDKGILYDDQATKHYKSILSDAEQLRKKDNGKYYSQDNLQYALDGWDDFLKNPDREAGQQYLQRAKTMTPYYDPSDEISKINKDCGTNSVSNEASTGKYIAGVSDKSKTSSKIYGCLEAGLSDKAKQQLKIEGHVAYGKNYGALQQDFTESANDKKKYYQQELGNRQAQMAALSKQKGTEAQVAQLKAESDQIGDAISSIDKDLTKYSSWDENYIKDNYDTLAYTAYSKRWKDSYSHAFATTDVNHTLKGNPIYITEFTQDQLNRRMSAGFAHDFSMSDYNFKQDVAKDNLNYQQAVSLAGVNAGYAINLENVKSQHELEKEMIKGIDKEGNVLDPIERLSRMQNAGYSPEQIQQYMGRATETTTDNADIMALKLNEYQTKDHEINNDVLGKLRTIMPDNTLLKSIGAQVKTPDDIQNVWRVAHQYIANAPKNDPLRQQLVDGENQSHQNTISHTALSSVYNNAKDRVVKQNPEIYNNYNKEFTKTVNGMKPYTTDKGDTLSPQRLMSIFSGQDPQYTLEIGHLPGTININSEPSGLIKDKRTNQIVGVSKDLEKLTSLNKDKSTNFNQKLNEELGKDQLTQKLVLNTGNVFTKGSRATKFVSDVVGGAFGELGKDYNPVSVGGLDTQTGEINIQLTDKQGKLIPASKIVETMAASGAGASNYSLVNENTVRIKIPGAAGIIATPQGDLDVRQVLDYASTNINNNQRELKLEVARGKDGIKYEVRVSKKIGGGVEYEILGNGTPLPIARIPGMDPKESTIKTLNTILHQ